MDEFLAIMQALDPTLDRADVQNSFAEIGASESLDEQLFGLWCNNMFGDYDDEQFRNQMLELLDVVVAT